MRSIDALWVTAYGEVRGVFPPEPLVFPVDAGELRALREALSSTASVEAFIRERLPAFDEAVPAIRRTTLARSTRVLAALDDLGAPGVLIEPVRDHLRAVAAPGWRPVFDPAAWLPDAAAAASMVDPEYRSEVDVDVSSLVLFAALCAVGPDARSVPVAAAQWHALRPAFPPVECGDVVVHLSLHDDAVERLDYALLPGGSALLAVTVPRGRAVPG